MLEVWLWVNAKNIIEYRLYIILITNIQMSVNHVLRKIERKFKLIEKAKHSY